MDNYEILIEEHKLPVEGVEKAFKAVTPRNAGGPEGLKNTGFWPSPE